MVAIGITSGVLIAQQDGTITKTAQVFSFTPGTKFPAPFGPNVNGSVNSVSPNVGVNLEFFTPALEIVPTKPRFFAAIEFLPTFAPNLTVALNDAATQFLVPDQQTNTFSALAIGGQGSRLNAIVMTSVVSADAGISFEFEFKERLLRFKPFAGWVRWGVQSTGRVLAAYKNDPLVPPNFPPFFGPDIRFVTVEGEGAEFFNAVGPGFELEMELEKRGPVRPVLYLMGAGYKTVGNDTFSYQANIGVNDALGAAAYSATWTFSVDDWSYRAGIGMRLRWVGGD